MIELYLTQNGYPKTGLSPEFMCMATAHTGVDKSGDAPSITEVSSTNAPGLYIFDIDFGIAPWDVKTEPLYMIVDIDPDDDLGLDYGERLIPLILSQEGLTLARLGAVRKFYSDGKEQVMKPDGVSVAVEYTDETANGITTTTPGAPS